MYLHYFLDRNQDIQYLLERIQLQHHLISKKLITEINI